MPGCFGAPEHCHGCLVGLSDGGASGGAGGDDGNGGNGGANGSGGTAGAGGVIATGGSATGGNATGGNATGGNATGGAATGGNATGGAATGGSATGGNATGGAATGGIATGGNATGGGMGGTASGGGGAGGGGTTGGAGGADPDLVLWYKFDEASGTTAADAAMSGGIARNATLATIGTGATATFSTMKQVGTHAVSLVPSATASNANGAFVNVPSLQTLAPTAITIAVWINLTVNTATQNWQRVFDYNVGTAATARNMYLTTRAADGTNTPPRFAITTTGNGAVEQRLDGTAALTANAWHHLAVVLPAGSPFTGTLYVDGMSVATNNAMTLHATDLGATVTNWLGRSRFSDALGSNPCFNGLIDDFRVYKRALTAPEITALIAQR
ncbi:MAG: LamG domain-containing protein [Pseudomonadota bacterium]